MIVKMKKVSIVILDSRKESSLRKLKRLGLVHLEKINGTGEKLAGLEEKRAFMEKCLYSLPDPVKSTKYEKYTNIEELEKVALEIDSLSSEITVLNDENLACLKELERIALYGDFNPEDIRELDEKGIRIDLIQLSKDEIADFPMDNSFVVARTKSGLTVAVVSRNGEYSSDRIHIELPEMSPVKMREKRLANLKKIEELEESLKKYAGYPDALKSGMAVLDDEIYFENVRSGMNQAESLTYLSGYCPEEKIELLKSHAARNSWAVLVKDPEEDEQPPTLLKNNRVVRIIQPVFDLLGTVPGYREYDISIWFLLFFTLFFAMIIGDAAYGSIFLVISIIVSIKGRKIPDGLKLFYLLSISTIVWGAMTGSWFGSDKLAAIPFLNQFIYEPVSNFNPLSGNFIKLMCFIVGTVHISLAHIKNIIKKIKTAGALADLGWLSMVLGLYYVVLNLVLDADIYPIPRYALYMIVGGLSLLVLFGQQEKGQNFFIGILKGVANLFTTFLDSISAFSDIISYIRLYAVGLATLAISQSFNSMAAGIGGGPGIIAAALILLFGHGLNIAMALLSVVVHGVRLNMLEFSSHLGMEWSGIKYEPFMESVSVGDNEKENSQREE